MPGATPLTHAAAADVAGENWPATLRNELAKRLGMQTAELASENQQIFAVAYEHHDPILCARRVRAFAAVSVNCYRQRIAG